MTSILVSPNRRYFAVVLPTASYNGIIIEDDIDVGNDIPVQGD